MTKAYRDPASPGTVSLGSTVQQLTYDAQGRRIVQQVMNSADLNRTEHYYHAGQSVVEIRNGSGLLLKQQLFAGMFPGVGDGYVDQLLQVAVNEDPFATDGSEEQCEAFFYALHDANYNLLALVDDDGAIAERYEYTPYGQRTVYFSPGPNDPLAMAPTTMSRRWEVGGVSQPYGLNTIGHQGKMHDEVTGLKENSARMYHPRLGRFMQRDPRRQNLPGGGYHDGMSLYQYLLSNPITYIDPTGRDADSSFPYAFDLMLHWNIGGGAEFIRGRRYDYSAVPPLAVFEDTAPTPPIVSLKGKRQQYAVGDSAWDSFMAGYIDNRRHGREALRFEALWQAGELPYSGSTATTHWELYESVTVPNSVLEPWAMRDDQWMRLTLHRPLNVKLSYYVKVLCDEVRFRSISFVWHDAGEMIGGIDTELDDGTTIPDERFEQIAPWGVTYPIRIGFTVGKSNWQVKDGEARQVSGWPEF